MSPKKTLTMLICVFAITGCSSSSDSDQSKLEASKQAPQDTQQEVIVDESLNQDIETLKKITNSKTQTAEDCNKVEDQNLRNSCKDEILYNQAVQTKNPELCKKISSPIFKQDCELTFN